MVTRKPSRAKQAPNPYLTTSTPDELEPPNRIAYEIMSERRDLLPSVERIMNAGLSAEATIDALTLFRTALQTPGDPHRDPAAAIARAAADHSEAPVPVES